jgi:hypothetical protein
MAPSAAEIQTQPQTGLPIYPGKFTTAKPWLKSTGVLDRFESFDVTPVIGKEFPQVQILDWLNSSNSDELLKELALTSLYPLLLPQM